MAMFRTEGARVSGITCCVGPETHTIEDFAARHGLDAQQLARLRQMTGIERRALAPPGVTALDLGEQAARRLLAGLQVDPATLDAILFVTQTPDHAQPCNANLLHARLACPKSVAAWDVNQGCSGWVYGLYQAFAMVAGGGARRVLLLAGDTISQIVNLEDRAVAPLFGDACAATLVERAAVPAPAWFALHSDGRGARAIWVPAGGRRQPLDAGPPAAEADADGNLRGAADLHMNGLEVFNFTLREEPGAVRELLAFAGHDLGQVDGFALHQASRFIHQNLLKRLGVDEERAPFSAGAHYGNQSSASVPGVLCHAFGDRLRREPLTMLCSGFGVGLSWAGCLARWEPLGCAEMLTYANP
jgi:3-oxoacyl-[acyl-carrier-protein] synthase-3